MNPDAFNAGPVLLFTSAFDWPAMLVRERWLPKWPSEADLDKGRDGNWHHSGKDWWTTAFRTDAQYWQKLCRFVIWWLAVVALL